MCQETQELISDFGQNILLSFWADLLATPEPKENIWKDKEGDLTALKSWGVSLGQKGQDEEKRKQGD